MDTVTRSEAIRDIRSKLLEMVDDDHSMCAVAAKEGIYCHGFRKLTDGQLGECYPWLLHRKPSMSRQELEDLADRWELARQEVNHVQLSCDSQQLEHDTCSGWDGFDNARLARFYLELVGREVRIA